MATRADVRRISLALPDAVEEGDDYGYAVPVGAKTRAFVWTWRERVHPKRARVPNRAVLGVRVADLDAKEILLMSDPDVFFTEPHYDGYAAVLVRLEKITRSALKTLLVQAHAATLAKPKRTARTKTATKTAAKKSAPRRR